MIKTFKTAKDLLGHLLNEGELYVTDETKVTLEDGLLSIDGVPTGFKDLGTMEFETTGPIADKAIVYAWNDSLPVIRFYDKINKSTFKPYQHTRNNKAYDHYSVIDHDTLSPSLLSYLLEMQDKLVEPEKSDDSTPSDCIGAIEGNTLTDITYTAAHDASFEGGQVVVIETEHSYDSNPPG